MRLYSYNRELNIATAQVLDIFNDIEIHRYTKDSGRTYLQKVIKVPCVYGNRSRILKSLENRSNTVQLPCMALEVVKYQRDEERVHSINNGLLYQTTGNEYDAVKNTAVPIDMYMHLDIIAKNQRDLDQILSNFITQFNPQVYFVWTNPKNLRTKMKCEILWNGEVEISYPSEILPTDPQRCFAGTTFVVKTWLFPGHSEIDDGERIKHINMFREVDGAIVSQANWYSVPTYTTFEDHEANLDNITEEHYDRLPILDAVSANYYLDIYGELSGTNYDPRYLDQLEVLLDNVNNPDLTLKTLSGDLLLPDSFDDVDWSDIWTRMLSGDLQDYRLS